MNSSFYLGRVAGIPLGVNYSWFVVFVMVASLMALYYFPWRYPEGSTATYWVLGFASRDYMVALRLPALYLDPVNDPQAALLAQFLEDAPSPIPVTGGYAGNEEGTTSLASQHGDWIAALSWPGAVLRVAGLTVHSGVRPAIYPRYDQIDRGVQQRGNTQPDAIRGAAFHGVDNTKPLMLDTFDGYRPAQRYRVSASRPLRFRSNYVHAAKIPNRVVRGR